MAEPIPTGAQKPSYFQQRLDYYLSRSISYEDAVKFATNEANEAAFEANKPALIAQIKAEHPNYTPSQIADELDKFELSRVRGITGLEYNPITGRSNIEETRMDAASVATANALRAQEAARIAALAQKPTPTTPSRVIYGTPTYSKGVIEEFTGKLSRGELPAGLTLSEYASSDWRKVAGPLAPQAGLQAVEQSPGGYVLYRWGNLEEATKNNLSIQETLISGLSARGTDEYGLVPAGSGIHFEKIFKNQDWQDAIKGVAAPAPQAGWTPEGAVRGLGEAVFGGGAHAATIEDLRAQAKEADIQATASLFEGGKALILLHPELVAKAGPGYEAALDKAIKDLAAKKPGESVYVPGLGITLTNPSKQEMKEAWKQDYFKQLAVNKTKPGFVGASFDENTGEMVFKFNVPIASNESVITYKGQQYKVNFGENAKPTGQLDILRQLGLAENPLGNLFQPSEVGKITTPQGTSEQRLDLSASKLLYEFPEQAKYAAKIVNGTYTIEEIGQNTGTGIFTKFAYDKNGMPVLLSAPGEPPVSYQLAVDADARIMKTFADIDASIITQQAQERVIEFQTGKPPYVRGSDVARFLSSPIKLGVMVAGSFEKTFIGASELVPAYANFFALTAKSSFATLTPHEEQVRIQLGQKEIPSATIETAIEPAFYLASDYALALGGKFVETTGKVATKVPFLGKFVKQVGKIKEPYAENVVFKSAGKFASEQGLASTGLLLGIQQDQTGGVSYDPIKGLGGVFALETGIFLGKAIPARISMLTKGGAFTEVKYVPKAEAQAMIDYGVVRAEQVDLTAAKSRVTFLEEQAKQVRGQALAIRNAAIAKASIPDEIADLKSQAKLLENAANRNSQLAKILRGSDLGLESLAIEKEINAKAFTNKAGELREKVSKIAIANFPEYTIPGEVTIKIAEENAAKLDAQAAKMDAEIRQLSYSVDKNAPKAPLYEFVSPSQKLGINFEEENIFGQREGKIIVNRNLGINIGKNRVFNLPLSMGYTGEKSIMQKIAGMSIFNEKTIAKIDIDRLDFVGQALRKDNSEMAENIFRSEQAANKNANRLLKELQAAKAEREPPLITPELEARRAKLREDLNYLAKITSKKEIGGLKSLGGIVPKMIIPKMARTIPKPKEGQAIKPKNMAKLFSVSKSEQAARQNLDINQAVNQAIQQSLGVKARTQGRINTRTQAQTRIMTRTQLNTMLKTKVQTRAQTKTQLQTRLLLEVPTKTRQKQLFSLLANARPKSEKGKNEGAKRGFRLTSDIVSQSYGIRAKKYDIGAAITGMGLRPLVGKKRGRK